MKKVLFVCLGNICRSPMAEFMFKDLVKKKGLENDFYIESAGTSGEEYGNPVYYLAKEKLAEAGITTEGKTARQMTKEDYDRFDYIIAMEERNVRNILRIVGSDPDKKISRLLDFSDNPRDISDPWYTRNFDSAYLDIKEGLEIFLEKIK